VLDRVHAMAHITGGGLLENLDRALPQTLDAVIDVSSWKTPNVFRVLMDAGSVEPAEMYRTFNMGVGIVVICAPSDLKAVLSAASAAGVAGWKIGSLSRHLRAVRSKGSVVGGIRGRSCGLEDRLAQTRFRRSHTFLRNL